MEVLLCSLVAAMAIIIAVLCVKIHLMRRAAREIAVSFHDRLTEDTNVLIDLSTRDPAMRRLAAEINGQLRLLRRERRRCQQGDLELKEAVTNISHDLRTPLTAISGYLDLLEREEKSEAVQRYLAHIRGRTEALKRLTEEFFRYSVVISPQALKPERMDVVRALEESLLSFYALMQERGVQPEIELPEEPVYRELDAGAVSRIFANIIGNALKYSPGDLTVVMHADGSIVFSNSAENLDPVAVGRLFDRFYTVEASRSSTGLGLSIARTLLERMGGRIEAEYRDARLSIRVMFPDQPSGI